jgi:CMP-N,N'-diacetyllegionaminic acid synthase
MIKSLAIIPARGGSKRIARKNLQELGGVPLVQHALRAAIDSQCFTDVLLTSDDDEILELGSRMNGVTTDRRDPAHATDKATVFGLVAALVARAEFQDRYDAVGLLLPTAPFRSANHVQDGFSLLNASCDAVVSVTRFEFPPQFGVLIDEESRQMTPYANPSPLLTGQTRSQDQAAIYHPNGALYLAWWSSYVEHGSFYKGRVRALEMSRLHSVDIDTPEDLEYARYQWARQQKVGK